LKTYLSLFRIVEIFTSCAVLLSALPLILFISIILFLTNKDGIIFPQSRAGYQNRPFLIFKFRTMLELYDDSNKLLPPDLRITKFGKVLRRCKLDELPNLINILKGEMSIIGPRAKLVSEVESRQDLSDKRQSMRPGLTGWAQVSGNTKLSIDEMFSLDLWYVQNRSLFIDILIIFKTILVIFWGERRNETEITRSLNEFRSFYRDSPNIT
jgi:lipopolysaccharide/colanic/teichoic acid biosynthesis glycosyltransferase